MIFAFSAKKDARASERFIVMAGGTGERRAVRRWARPGRGKKRVAERAWRFTGTWQEVQGRWFRCFPGGL